MDSYKGLCEVCGKSFTMRKDLYRHLRSFHDVEVHSNGGKFSSSSALERHQKTHAPAPQKLSCTECGTFTCSTMKDLRGHLESEHGLNTPQKLSCTECGTFMCSTRKDLRGHLESEHGLNMETKEMDFDSWEQFIQWKLKVGSDEKVSFVKNTGDKMMGIEKSFVYYICHRSGTPASKSLGKRCRAPSVKIGHTCPASLTVTKMSSGKIGVKYYMTHTGHNFSLGSLHLTPADRAMVAGQIAAGVSDAEILKRVRESVCEGYFKRLHLLERKDIYNIRKKYRLDESLAHENDAVSVHLWVKQQKLLGEDSSVLFYKAQGEESEILSNSDFMLVLMTPFQLEMAKSFAPEKVLIDTTHGRNKYNFHLTTLMTVDEFGVGCPVAFCLSTHIDTTAMEVFMHAVKERVGTIKTQVFMSDDYPSYYNAWCAVMGQCAHRLLCTWHVDKAWRRCLRTKIKDIMLKCNVYKVLKVLHFDTNQAKFSEMLEAFLKWCSEEAETLEFGQYFINEYAKRPEMWAYCYRIGLGLNTNMYLEAHHKTLKHYYLSAKVNNRVDKCIQVLLHRSRDLLYERAIRLTKGGLGSGRIAKIVQSHKSSGSIKEENIESLDTDKWELLVNGRSYIVATADTTCDGCPLSCPTCKVCVHMYQCSCIDFMVKGNMCKHIHAVAVRYANIMGPIQVSTSQEEALQVVTETAALEPPSVATTLDWKTELLGKIAVLQGLAANLSAEDAPDIMSKVDKLIQKTSAAISARKGNLGGQVATTPHFPLTGARAPANQKSQNQRGFYSVKKGRSKPGNNLSAPTHAETVEIEEGLLHGQNISTGSDHTYI